MKKILSIFICAVTIITNLSAFGAEENVIDSKVVIESDRVVTLSATPTVTADVNTHSSAFGEPVSIFDTVGMVGTAEGAALPSNKNRWTAAADAREVTLVIEFAEDVTFSQIQWTEGRKVIEQYEIVGYKNDSEIKTFTGTMTDGSTNANNAFLRMISLGEYITVDKITFKASAYAENTNVISICEMELWKTGEVPVIADENGEDLTISSGAAADMFDNDEGTACKIDVSGKTKSTISFKLSEMITSDSIKLCSDDVEKIVLYGSIDGERYFEIPHKEIDSDGVFHFDSPELLSSVKAELLLTENRTELEISEIAMYRKIEDSVFDDLAELFNGTDTSYITDENLDLITKNINNPLPSSFGSYDIEWTSSDSNILDVDTGEITRSYVRQSVQLTASFKRNGVIYKENKYDIKVCEELPVLTEGKYSYSGDKVNLSSHIISSSAFDVNGNDPRDPAYGTVATLYDESHKLSGFSGNNANCWIAYAMTAAEFASFPMPYTLQFDLDTSVAVNSIDIWEYRDRIKKVDVLVSVDGKVWTAAVENADTIALETDANDTNIKRKNVKFPLAYAKHIRIVIKELLPTTKYAATKLCEIVLLNEQSLPTVDGVESSYVADSDSSTYAEIVGSGSIIVDMGKITGFDSFRWISSGAPVNEYRISVSNNGADWEDVKNGQLLQSAGALIEIDLEDYVIARYVKLDIESLHAGESAKIAEVDLMEQSEYDLYRTEKNLANLIDNNETDILIGESLTLLTADELDAIVEEVNFYNLDWDFSGAPMINPETKKITHTDEDVAGVIAVSVTDSITGYIIYAHEFDVVVKVAFDEASYYTATEEAYIDSGIYDMGRPEGFLFDQDNMMIEFSVEDDEEGTVVMNSGEELLSVDFTENAVLVCYKDKTKTIKRNVDMSVRVILYEDRFEFYTKSDTEPFRGVIADGVYKNEKTEGIKTISTEIVLSDVKFKIYKDCLDEFLNQLNLSHISEETMYTVSQQLSFINELIGLDIVWTSSDNDIINAKTGAVDNNADPCYVKLTASINENEVIKWSKTLYLTVNMENIISQGVVSANTISYQGNVLSNLYDADIETSFVTNYKNGYNIEIDFPANTPVSQIAIIEDTDEGSIDEFDIYADGNLVYEGGKVNGFINCLLDSVIAKEVKIVVKKTTGITGIREISINSELSNAQKAASDLTSVGISSNYENGVHTLPKIGVYGSVLTYSADKSIVSFEEGSDGFTMTVNNDSVDTSVVITATASYKGITVTKHYSIVAKGKETVSYNPPAGGGGSGGGGGGGGNYAPAGTTSSNAPVSNTPDELSGHWAEKEIRSLVNKGVVQGNGNSLNLDGTVTRAEFLTMLTRVLETPISENKPVFNDVLSDDWFADVLQTAYENGWIEGYNNNALPNTYITREEMVKIICCSLKINLDENTQYTEFSDADMQSEWAKDYIKALSSKNIINGYTDGSFKPKNNLKRDEAMVIIYRIQNMEVE